MISFSVSTRTISASSTVPQDHYQRQKDKAAHAYETSKGKAADAYDTTKDKASNAYQTVKGKVGKRVVFVTLHCRLICIIRIV